MDLMMGSNPKKAYVFAQIAGKFTPGEARMIVCTFFEIRWLA